MKSKVVELAYRGAWLELLRLLENQPQLVGAAGTKGYTPLHQAAWHGAEPLVIGRLLALGADPTTRTYSRGQLAVDIALEKHPSKEHLPFLLSPRKRTVGQLLRKFIADNPNLFGSYDGNKLLCDRVLSCLYSGDGRSGEADVAQTLSAAIHATAGPAFLKTEEIVIGPPTYKMTATSPLWLRKIIPSVVEMSSRAHLIPLTRSYAVMSDLFDPLPSQWGLRGDLFLWMEMRQALCHVPVPTSGEAVKRVLAGCFVALTGEYVARGMNLGIERFARGGMSSGMVCGDAWADQLLPKLEQRAEWLRNSWV